MKEAADRLMDIPVGLAPKVIMMEDHDQAYYAWQQRGFKGMTLVHVDAHLDFCWLPEIDLQEVEGNGPGDLEGLLRDQPLWNPYLQKRMKMVDIGNYIFPAIREGIVRKIYWVVPDPTWESRRGRGYLKRVLKLLLGLKKRVDVGLREFGDHFYFRALGVDFFVYSLRNLPAFSERVLLDIDVDFLLTPFVWKDIDLGRRPWLGPKELFERLSSGKINAEAVTISYSVEGGFTPLAYKYFGDALRSMFERRGEADGCLALKMRADELRRRGQYGAACACYEEAAKTDPADASVHFALSLMSLSAGAPRIDEARAHYQKAVSLDKSYGSAFNNYGPIWLRRGKLDKAEREFLRFFRLDENNKHVLTGLGFVSLRKKRYREAEEYFRRVLAADPVFFSALFGLGVVYWHSGRLDGAREVFLKLSETAPEGGDVFWWLGRICEKKGEARQAVGYYKQAVLWGGEGPGIHLLLARLYLAKGLYLRVFEELKRSLRLFALMRFS
jgi:tetratricopeptide (TPR) repeat protein